MSLDNIHAKSFEFALIAKRLLFLAPRVAELKEKHSLKRMHLTAICVHLRLNYKVCVSLCGSVAN
jgi:hypothetical protein